MKTCRHRNTRVRSDLWSECEPLECRRLLSNYVFNGTAAGEVIEVNAGVGFTLVKIGSSVQSAPTQAGDVVVINGNGGNDGFIIDNIASSLVVDVYGNTGDETLYPTNASDPAQYDLAAHLKGRLEYYANTGTDRVFAFDRAAGGNFGYAFSTISSPTLGSLTKPGSGMGSFLFQGVDNFELDTDPTTNDIAVNYTVAGTNYDLRSENGGADRLLIGGTDFAANINGSVQWAAPTSNANNTVQIDDTSGTSTANANIRSDSFNMGSGPTVAWSGADAISYGGSPLANPIKVFDTVASVPVNLYPFGGADTIYIGGNSAVDLESVIKGTITIGPSTASPADTIIVNDSADDSGNDTYNFDFNGSNVPTLTKQAGSGMAAISWNDAANVGFTGNNFNNTINVNRLRAIDSLLLHGADGVDTFNVGAGDYDSRILGAVTLDGDAGVDTLTFDDSIDNAGPDTYLFSTGNTFEKVGQGKTEFHDVASVSLRCNDLDSLIRVDKTNASTLIIDTGDGNDDVIFGGGNYAANIPGDITITSGTGTKTLTIDDSASLAATNVTHSIDRLSATQLIYAHSTQGSITYATAFSALTINGGSANDTVNAARTGGFILSANNPLNLIVNGNAGNDVVSVGFGSINADIIGGVTLHGGAGTDALVFDDSSATSGLTYAFTPNTFDKSNYPGVMTFDGFETTRLDTGSPDQIFNIDGVASSNTVTINAGTGNDTFNINALSNLLDSTAGNLVISGQGGIDSIALNDSAGTDNDAYTITSTTFDKNAFGLLTYATTELLTLNAGGGSDTINAVSKLATCDLIINAGNGNDTLTFGGLGANGDVDNATGNTTIAGGAGADTITFDDTLNDLPTGAPTYTLTATTITRTNLGGTLAYNTAEGVFISCGVDNDTVNVTGTSTPVNINGNGGTDTILVQQTGAGTIANVIASAGPDTLSVNGGNVGSASVAILGSAARLAGLIIGNGGAVQYARQTVGQTTYLKINTLSINSTGHLELFDNDLIVTTTSKATIQNYVKTAYNFGGFNGAGGIFSSTGRDNPTGNTALGLLSGTEFINNNGGTFNGQTVATSDVLVKYTYYGDVDFNGAVDSTDYNLIDFGFLTGASDWANGDVDYSGSIDSTDYNNIDFAFVTQSGLL